MTQKLNLMFAYNDIKCQICFKIFKKREHYIRHIQENHKEALIKCELCKDSKKYNREEFQLHNITKHGYNFCKKCAKIYETNEFHNCGKLKNVFVCDLENCANLVFMKMKKYVRHLNMEHGIDRPPMIEYLLTEKRQCVVTGVTQDEEIFTQDSQSSGKLSRSASLEKASKVQFKKNKRRGIIIEEDLEEEEEINNDDVKGSSMCVNVNSISNQESQKERTDNPSEEEEQRDLAQKTDSLSIGSQRNVFENNLNQNYIKDMERDLKNQYLM
jgi:uncharacterized C2H2 Zn-finger protein